MDDAATYPHGHTSWVEVSLRALKQNLAEVKSFVGPSVKVMAVVKANAYGHGTVGASRAFVEAGADYLAVTTLEEALEVREGGITTPMLVFSPLLPDQIEAALSNDLDQTVCDLSLAESISQAAEKLGRTARIHVKIDTGMGRLGVIADDAPDFMYRLANLPGLEVAGVYTHFANALDQDLSDARRQNARFAAVIELLKSKDMPTGLCHAANSAGLLRMKDAHYDMVRPGTILYGQYPTRHIQNKLNLEDTWRLKSRITALRKLPAGSQVGYGSEYKASKQIISAVLPVGYADGFTLVPESIAQRAARPLRMVAERLMGGHKGPCVTVLGQRAPVIGRVSMQMCSVDVTHIPGIQVGDEAIIPARRVTTSSRIPRVYSD